MEPQADFSELLALFNAHGVEYLVVGAYALAFHGVPRYTGDLHLWVRPDGENGGRVLAALAAFGFGDLGLTLEDLTREERVVQLGYPPVRIDLLTSLTGVTWEEAWREAVPGRYGDVPVRYLGRQALVANKRALGRHQDRADLEALGEEP